MSHSQARELPGDTITVRKSYEFLPYDYEPEFKERVRERAVDLHLYKPDFYWARTRGMKRIVNIRVTGPRVTVERFFEYVLQVSLFD